MSLAAAICLLIPGIPKTSAKDNFTFAPGLDIFTNLEDLLNFFRSDASLLARQILKVFKRDCLYVNNAAFKDSSEKPFIVIVGNHRATREAVGITVAQMLGGKYMTYPAPCLQRFISQMPKGTMLRRAFYFLSNYASAFYVKIQLSLNNPVVLNGYYFEQLTFSIVNSFPPDGVPPVVSELYNFPEDLLRPNLVFFVNFSDQLMFKRVTTRSPAHWKPRTVNLYRLMQSRHPIVIQEASRFPRDTAFSIYNYILDHLRHRDGKWHHEPPGNKCTVHLSISHLPTTYKYNLYYPPTEVTDVAVM
uniref:Carboxylesterase type B domain-containing protein n=2 Tax=Homalodisca liturata TaxID=320908 RepID=A0A1B6HY49_9HEMI